MNRSRTSLLASAILFVPTSAFAAPATNGGPPAPISLSPQHQTGQPDQSCEDLGNQPGQSMNASGSAYNPDGTSGTVYAGNRDPINDKNTASASQYDVACLVNQSGGQ